MQLLKMIIKMMCVYILFMLYFDVGLYFLEIKVFVIAFVSHVTNGAVTQHVNIQGYSLKSRILGTSFFGLNHTKN